MNNFEKLLLQKDEEITRLKELLKTMKSQKNKAKEVMVLARFVLYQKLKDRIKWNTKGWPKRSMLQLNQRQIVN